MRKLCGAPREARRQRRNVGKLHAMPNRETKALKAVKKQILQLNPSEIAELRPWVLARFDVQATTGESISTKNPT